jgi:hypothetical protein
MMEAARTSETSADIQLKTRQYIPEDSELITTYIIVLAGLAVQTAIFQTKQASMSSPGSFYLTQ